MKEVFFILFISIVGLSAAEMPTNDLSNNTASRQTRAPRPPSGQRDNAPSRTGQPILAPIAPSITQVAAPDYLTLLIKANSEQEAKVAGPTQKLIDRFFKAHEFAHDIDFSFLEACEHKLHNVNPNIPMNSNEFAQYENGWKRLIRYLYQVTIFIPNPQQLRRLANRNAI